MSIDVAQISALLMHPTWDVIAIFVFVGGGFFYGWASGKARLVAVLMAMYLAQLIFVNAQFLNSFTAGRDLMEVFILRIVFFVTITMALAAFLIRTIFNMLPEGERVWWQLFLLSFAEVGLLMSTIFRLLPASELFSFSPLVKYVFASQAAFSTWLILPLIALFVTMRRRY